MKLFIPAGLLALISTVLIGCSSTPTALDRYFANVETNYTPKLVLQTNVVTLFQTNVVIETRTITNEVGVPVPVYYTNTTTVVNYSTNVVMSTNMVPVYTFTASTNAVATAQAAGGISNILIPGTGGLVTSGLLAALSIFLGIRNRKFAGENDALSQSAGVLTQIIETGREIMVKEPQGQRLADAFTQWMVTHQAETETIGKIAELVKSSTDNSQAKAAADQILALIGQKPQV